MTKYIDADRLKAEIESRMGNYDANSKNPNQLLWAELAALIPFIDSLQQEQEKENVEKVCGTCTYWQEGTLDRGQCQAGEPHQTHSADTCDRWERHEEIPMKEQPSEGYDEAYLKEKIAKASKTWKGVDVDKYMAEMRGYEQPSEDLEKAAIAEYPTLEGLPDAMNALIAHRQIAFKKGALWQKEQMLKDAVEGTVIESFNPVSSRPEHGITLIYEDEGKPYWLPGDHFKFISIKED